MLVVVDKDNYEAEVDKCDIPVVVDFWGPQCGPCLALLPEIEKLAEKYAGKIKICKLNVAENRRFCMTLKVMALPSFLFYTGGECKTRLAGDAATIEAITAQCEALLG